MIRVRWFVALAFVLVTSGCAGSSSSPARDGIAVDSFATPFGDVKAYPAIVSSDIAVGPNRLLVGLLNGNDAPIGSPSIRVRIAFFDLQRSAKSPVSRSEMRFVWIDKPYRGIYESTTTFGSAGKWGAEVTIRGGRSDLNEVVRTTFEVRQESSTPGIGERPPAVDTPTIDYATKLSAITTDPDPVPRFYKTSIAEALESQKPFVAVFATPKFCVSKTCGPMLDVVKGVAPQFDDVTFIHVEPYQLPIDPANLEAAPAMREWGLPTEPWTFVIDRSGRVAAKFEGAMSAGELRNALRDL